MALRRVRARFCHFLRNETHYRVVSSLIWAAPPVKDRWENQLCFFPTSFVGQSTSTTKCKADCMSENMTSLFDGCTLATLFFSIYSDSILHCAVQSIMFRAKKDLGSSSVLHIQLDLCRVQTSHISFSISMIRAKSISAALRASSFSRFFLPAAAISPLTYT